MELGAAESLNEASTAPTMTRTLMKHLLEASDAYINSVTTDSNASDDFGNLTDPAHSIIMLDTNIISLRLVLKRMVVPTIAGVGFIANSLNMAILARLNKRKSLPIYSILMAMTAADILVTACNLLESVVLYMRPDPILYANDVERLSSVESIIYYSLDPASNVFGFISNWCTVAMAAFRFVGVYYCTNASAWCTQRCASFTIATTVAVSVIIAVPLSAHRAYQSITDTESHPAYCELFFAIACDVLPWILCVILVSCLLFSLHRSSWDDSRAELRRHMRASDRHRQLTVTLILTAAWYVVTTAPSTVTVLMSFWNDSFLLFSPLFLKLHLVSQTLILLNFNGNFFFYSLINKRHRQELKRLLCLKASQRRWSPNTHYLLLKYQSLSLQQQSTVQKTVV